MSVYLATRGKQDYFLTERPDFTFFNTVYSRDLQHVNTTTTVPFDSGGGTIATLPSSGDYISDITLKVTLPALNPQSNYWVFLGTPPAGNVSFYGKSLDIPIDTINSTNYLPHIATNGKFNFDFSKTITNQTISSILPTVTAISTYVSYTTTITAICANTNDNSIFVVDTAGNSVTKITFAGVVTPGYVTGLNAPNSICSDGSNLYIANSGNNTITKVDYTGVIISASFVTGVNVVPSGMSFVNSNVYVSDILTNKVIRIDPNTGTKTSLSIAGITTPGALCVDPTAVRQFYVLDTSNNTIYNTIGSGTATSYISGLVSPNAICTDPSGNLFITLGAGTVTEVLKVGTVTVPNYMTGLNDPRGIFSDSNGSIYVVNNGTTSIIKNDVLTVTLQGTGITLSSIPVAICSDSSGYYVTNSAGNSVTKITFAGVVTPGYVTGLNAPNSICSDGSNLYIANSGNNTITKVDYTGVIISASFVTGVNVVPSGMSFVNSNVYVSDTLTNKIIRINTTTGAKSAFPTNPYNIPSIPGPMCSNPTKPGYVTVLDNNDGTIYNYSVYNNNSFNGYNISPGNAKGICADLRGRLLVTRTDGTVFIFTGSNTYYYNYITGLSDPRGLAVDSSGNVYVTNAGNNKITKYVPNGQVTFAATGFSPLGICSDTLGNLFTANSSDKTVTKITSGPSVQSGYGTGLPDPDGICSDSLGNIYITNPTNNTVTKIAPSLITPIFFSSVSFASLSGPGGVAVRPGGAYPQVVNSNGSLVDADPTSSGGLPVYGFNDPRGICWTSTYVEYITEYGTNSVCRYNQVAPNTFPNPGTYERNYITGLTGGPCGICPDSSNNLYITIPLTDSVTKAVPETNSPNVTFASASNPKSVCVDSSGNVYATCTGTNAVTKISPSGTVLNASYITGLIDPHGICIDSSGNLYIANSGNNSVTRYSTVTNARNDSYVTGLSYPWGVCLDPSGNLFITNRDDNTLTMVSPGGLTITRNYVTGFTKPKGICSDPSGNLYIINDKSFYLQASTISKVSSAGGVNYTFITTRDPFYINYPSEICADSLGNFYMSYAYSSTTSFIAKISSSWTMFNRIYVKNNLSNAPLGMYVDSSGNLFVANSAGYSANAYDNTISKMPVNGSYATVTPLYVTGLKDPRGICFDSSGNNLYITNYGNNTIAKFSIGSNVRTDNYVTGLSGPVGICIDASYNLYIANSLSNSVTKVSPLGAVTNKFITTGLSSPVGIAYDGVKTLFITNYAIDTVTSVFLSTAQTPNYVTGLSTPRGICSDSSDNLYITNQGNNTVTKVSSTLVITNGYVTGLSTPWGICADSGANLYIVNQGNSTVTRVTSNGSADYYYITTGLTSPTSICADPSGNLYILNSNASVTGVCIPLITSGTVGVTIPYSLRFVSPNYITGLSSPYALSSDPTGNLYVTSTVSKTITKVQLTSVQIVPFCLVGGGTAFSTLDTGLNLRNNGGPAIATGLSTSYAYMIASADNSYLYISDFYAGKIFRFTRSTNLIGTYVTGLTNPISLSIDNSGILYVLCDYGSITQIDTTGGSPVVTPQFVTLTKKSYKISVNSAGTILYILYGSGNSIAKVSVSQPTIVDYTYISSVSAAYIADMKIDPTNGNLYFLDYYGGTIIALNITSKAITPNYIIGLKYPTSLGIRSSGVYDVLGWYSTYFTSIDTTITHTVIDYIIFDNIDIANYYGFRPDLLQLLGGYYKYSFTSTQGNISSPLYLDECGWAKISTNELLRNPEELVVSPDGSLVYFVDSENCTVRKMNTATPYEVTTIAGTPGIAGSSDGPGQTAGFFVPQGLTISPDGLYLYVADTQNSTLRRVSTKSPYTVITIAGLAGTAGSTDGAGSIARFNYLQALAISPDGAYLYVADTQNFTVRRVSTASPYTVITMAGLALTTGSTDGVGTVARFSYFQALTVSPDGSYLYVADTQNFTVRRVATTSPYTVITIAGSVGNLGYVDGTGISARFSLVQSMTISTSGIYLYIGDSNLVRRVSTTSPYTVTTLAGTSSPGSSDGNGTNSSFNKIQGLVLAGNVLYASDTGNNTIRRVGTASPYTVTTLAGSPNIAGYADTTVDAYPDDTMYYYINSMSLVIGKQVVQQLPSGYLKLKRDISNTYKNRPSLKLLEGDTNIAASDRVYFFKTGLLKNIPVHLLKNQDIQVIVDSKMAQKSLLIEYVTFNGIQLPQEYTIIVPQVQTFKGSGKIDIKGPITKLMADQAFDFSINGENLFNSDTSNVSQLENLMNVSTLGYINVFNGPMNMGRIREKTISGPVKNSNVWAEVLNVLKIQDGLAGVLFESSFYNFSAPSSYLIS